MSTEEIKTDYCIAGGGIAGIILASRLAESGKKIVVLEQGPHFTEDDRKQYLVFEAYESATRTVAQDSGLKQLDQLDKVAHALSHAWTHGVVHGDLCNDSIQFDAQGDPKIVGLGVCQCTDLEVDVHQLADHDLKAIHGMVSDCLDGTHATASGEHATDR